MKKQKSGFTLIEILVVLFFMAIILAFSNLTFRPENKNKYNGQTCLNKINSEIKNYMYSSITNKGLSSGTNLVFPDFYQMQFLGTNNITPNTIKLTYIKDGTTQDYETIDMQNDSYFKCSGKGYSIQIAPDTNTTLKIVKGLKQTDESHLPFEIIGGNAGQFTGSVNFELCYEGLCQQFGRLNFDSRAQSIRTEYCLLYDETDDSKCKNRG